MKLTIFMTIALFSILSFATPKIGDKVNFVARVLKGETKYLGEYSIEIIAYNQGSDQWTMVHTERFPEESSTKEVIMATDKLLNDAQIVSVLTHCNQAGGTSEMIQTETGRIDTCAVPTGNAKVWVGRVPLGVVKYHQDKDGQVTDLLLKSFVNGR